MQTSNRPALVILDIHMANKDGIAAIEDFKLIKRRFRLRFMTGGEESHAVAASMIARARDFDVGRTLYKPFSLTRFKEVVQADMALLEKPYPTFQP